MTSLIRPPGDAWRKALWRNPLDQPRRYPNPPPPRQPPTQPPPAPREDGSRDFSRAGKAIAITALAGTLVAGAAVDRPAEGPGALPAANEQCAAPAELATRNGRVIRLSLASFNTAQQCEAGTTENGVLVPPSEVTLAGVVDCNCGDDGTLLAGPYYRDCISAENTVQKIADTEGLDLRAEEGEIVSGNGFCDSITSGPGAWPVLDGPAKPGNERAPPIPVCTSTTGLIGVCKD